MYVVAIILAAAAGLFYVAGTEGLWASTLCQYGDVFCQHPSWLGAAAALALVWAVVVKV